MKKRVGKSMVLVVKPGLNSDCHLKPYDPKSFNFYIRIILHCCIIGRITDKIATNTWRIMGAQ